MNARWRLLLPLLLALLSGCAMVTVQTRGPEDYLAQTRGDILSTNLLSEASQESLQVAGIAPKACLADVTACSTQLDGIDGLGDERRLATQAELWSAKAIAASKRQPLEDAAIGAWLEAARRAYAYLFFTGRTPGERAFENRQTQVRDYYNYAVARVSEAMYARWTAQTDPTTGLGTDVLAIGDWRLRTEMEGFRLPGDATRPASLTQAATLHFDGVRSTYRRDGFGAELVAEVSRTDVGDLTAGAGAASGQVQGPSHDFSEMPYAPATVLMRFEGQTLAQVLQGHQVAIVPYDPYRQNAIELHGQRVPLAGNFTAAYGLWLAHSGFARQSLRSMLGRGDGLDRPHLYLMQPFDPQRRIILMLHGLASSPEAWVNLANEIMGDEALRQHYQIWQVYYPTNMPIAWNRQQIQALVEQTLDHFDPARQAPVSSRMVVIGHSMGGVLARLLVSSSGDTLWNALLADRKLEGDRGRRVRERLQPMLQFQPLPEVDRAIFIAAPQRGTPMADGRLARLVGRLVRLPATLLNRFGEVMQDLADQDAQGKPHKAVLPNSIDNLRDTDPFVRAAADLPISPQVRYNTIIARRDPALALADSDDGLVPYRSAHLAGAESEQVITSGHSVQETAQAILEIRRILHAQMALEADAPK
ncbi:alpha/beta fold hydrolase [Pseudoxanthomonas winnipegensis]|uniref:Alpha/beta fold hydrolase n=1 Tax=Pseudoxanthomonas winnipegensis TaxID=2480810 RepID=A0A4Q8LGC4_9GAMM|nr:alpha/beta fold hydrolase [Pseudoxanthomonas winnipegensis]TAA28510.1 alpha/beta fold hydrolase [Pseudoxanthomonas winnipegensis]